MFRTLILVLLAGVTLLSCSLGGGTVYYPKYHMVALRAQLDGKGTITYLNWGDKLVYLNQIATNTNKAGQATYFAYVKNSIDNFTGYVDIDNVIKSPVSRCVIVNNAIMYKTPSELSREKQNVIPPMLAYVLEVKDGGWAMIQPYNVPAIYTLTNDQTALTPVWYQYISVKDYSVNPGDIDMVIALQLAVRKYNESKKSYEASPEEKTLKTFLDAIRPEADNIKKIMEKYPQANPAIVSEVQKFLNITSPLLEGTDSSGDSNSPPAESTDTTPGSEEEL